MAWTPLRFLLTGGQRHDITQAKALIADFEFERVIADRSYDAEEFLLVIADQQAEAVIPPRKNRQETTSMTSIFTKSGIW